MQLDDYMTRMALPHEQRLLARYLAAASPGVLPPLALLDGTTMAEVRDELTVVEPEATGEFKYLYCGAAVTRMTGSDFTGKTTAHQSPKAGTVSRQGFAKALSTGAPAVSLDRTGENGSATLWGRLHLPFQDKDGRPLVVTLNRPQEYTDELLRDILDAAADGILAVRAIRAPNRAVTDFAIIAVNTPMAEILQDSAERLTTATLLQRLPYVKDDGSWDRHLAVLETRTCCSFECRFIQNGATHWYRIVSAPLNDGLVISYTDITELKQLNLKLEEQRQQLEDEIARRLKVEDELWNLAHLDSLTGIANRRAMHIRATKGLAEAAARGASCAMIALDIDHFKQVNDTYGHAAGDAAIIRVAEIARSGLRGEKDIVARMGGEEFAMLLQDADIKAGLAVAERLRKVIEQTEITCDGKSFSLTVSFGVAASKDGTTYESLMRTADKALYSAKRAGRNQSHATADLSDAA